MCGPGEIKKSCSTLGSPLMTSTPRHMETLDRKTVRSDNNMNNVMDNMRSVVISHSGLEPVVRDNTPTVYRRLQSPRSDLGLGAGARGEIYGRLRSRLGDGVLNSPAR